MPVHKDDSFGLYGLAIAPDNIRLPLVICETESEMNVAGRMASRRQDTKRRWAAVAAITLAATFALTQASNADDLQSPGSSSAVYDFNSPAGARSTSFDPGDGSAAALEAAEAAALACVANVPAPDIRVVSGARQMYATGLANCPAGAPTGVRYRVHLQQFNGSGYVNLGTSGVTNVPPGGGVQRATATFTCGVTLQTVWRAYGHFYKNGIPVGSAITGNGVHMSCS